MDDINGDPALEDAPPGDGSESALPAVSEDPSLGSALDFDKGRGVHVRRTELALPGEMSFDSWREFGSQVVLIANCSAWWVGDWLVYGEQAYGDRYEQAITDTSLAYQTLRNYAWVARRVPVSRRLDTLSFGHHAEVAPLPGGEQEAWLARAKKMNWSRRQLRQGLRVAQSDNRRVLDAEGSDHTRMLEINVTNEQHDRWQSAAERKNYSVTDWIVATLDLATREDPNIEPPL